MLVTPQPCKIGRTVTWVKLSVHKNVKFIIVKCNMCCRVTVTNMRCWLSCDERVLSFKHSDDLYLFNLRKVLAITFLKMRFWILILCMYILLYFVHEILCCNDIQKQYLSYYVWTEILYIRVMYTTLHVLVSGQAKLCWHSVILFLSTSFCVCLWVERFAP